MTFILELLFSRQGPNPLVARKIIGLLNFLRFFMGKKQIPTVEINRIINVLNLSKNRERTPEPLEKAQISLIICSSSRDLDILPHTIEFGIKALSNLDLKEIFVVAPDDIVNTIASNLTIPLLQVIPESELIEIDNFRLLYKTKFPSRENWCLQQFLKLAAILRSKSPYALVIDADTLLLRTREWIDSKGKTALMPTFEYQPQYYSFINRLNPNIPIASISYVSHHMIYNVALIRLMLSEINVKDIRNFWEKCFSLSEASTQSPFCIDYEFFAQSLQNSAPTQFFNLRWANLSLSRKHLDILLNYSLVRRIARIFFNSISFHWWH